MRVSTGLAVLVTLLASSMVMVAADDVKTAFKPSARMQEFSRRMGGSSGHGLKFNLTKILNNQKLAALKKAASIQTVESQIVPTVEAVTLDSGTGDISTTGACKDTITKSCSSVQPGEGRLAECIGNLMADQKVTDDVPEGCKKAVHTFKIHLSENINADIKLATACKEDAHKFCGNGTLYPEPGAVITCLREVEEKLESACKAEVFRTKEEAAKDYTLDAMLHELCEEDKEALCPNTNSKGGEAQECLRKKRASLSWDCQEELFRQEVEDADNLKLNPVLLRLCKNDKKTFCGDVKPGMGRAIECLETNRDKPGFSAECKAKFEEMMARRASDFRLDAKLREECRSDIEEVCGYEKDSLDSVAGYDGRVIECLQDYKEELAVPDCKAAVHKLTERAAQDIRMDRPLADACFDDRKTLCGGIEPGNARVLRCLQDQRSNLTFECRATLFDQEVRFAEDIDFQFPLKKACETEIGNFCKDVPHGHGRIIGCLQENDDNKQMSEECRAEVKRSEYREAEDYRLNYRVNKACDMEIDNICPDVCSPFQGQACGGKVIDCLTTNIKKIQSVDCVKELMPSIKGTITDMKRDPVSMNTCQLDIENFNCGASEEWSGVKPRMLPCLRDNYRELEPECRDHVAKLSNFEFNNIQLGPMKTTCEEEIKVFCPKVKAGGSRVVRCLEANQEKSDFSDKCKSELTKREKALGETFRFDQAIQDICRVDIDSTCAEEKEAQDEEPDGQVINCLTTKYDQLKEQKCQDGVLLQFSKSIVLGVYSPDTYAGAWSQICDEDLANCVITEEGLDETKKVDTIKCLTTEHPPTQPACITLIDKFKQHGTDMDSFMGSMDKSGVVEQVEKASKVIDELLKVKGTDPDAPATAVPAHSDVMVTGWVAIAGIIALLVCIAVGGYFAYQKFTGQDKVGQYTMVVKGGDI